jgi:hypothetical protein
MTVCRGMGVGGIHAVYIALAVGAILCEYHHIPPWTSAVVSRLQAATTEVQSALVSTQT